jgi:hypothetical protein
MELKKEDTDKQGLEQMPPAPRGRVLHVQGVTHRLFGKLYAKMCILTRKWCLKTPLFV